MYIKINIISSTSYSPIEWDFHKYREYTETNFWIKVQITSLSLCLHWVNISNKGWFILKTSKQLKRDVFAAPKLHLFYMSKGVFILIYKMNKFSPLLGGKVYIEYNLSFLAEFNENSGCLIMLENEPESTTYNMYGGTK